MKCAGEQSGSPVCVSCGGGSEGPIREAGRGWPGMCLVSGQIQSGSRHSLCDHSFQRTPNLEGSLGDL